MARTTKTAKKNAVNKVIALVKNGVNITLARSTVAEDLGFRSGSTLGHWQRELGIKIPVVTTKIAKSTNNVAITRNITTDPSIGKAKAHMNRVLTAHVNGTGEFSTKQVLATCQLSSGILAFSKHELEVAKWVNKNVINPGKDGSLIL